MALGTDQMLIVFLAVITESFQYELAYESIRKYNIEETVHYISIIRLFQFALHSFMP